MAIDARHSQQQAKRLRWARLLVAAVLALAFTWVAMVIWDPTNPIWARNAYGMSQVGAWTGIEAVGAYVAYWFYEFWGRTILSSAMLAAQCWALWRCL